MMRAIKWSTELEEKFWECHKHLQAMLQSGYTLNRSVPAGLRTDDTDYNARLKAAREIYEYNFANKGKYEGIATQWFSSDPKVVELGEAKKQTIARYLPEFVQWTRDYIVYVEGRLELSKIPRGDSIWTLLNNLRVAYTNLVHVIEKV